jgi:CHAT domain-containing protein
VVQRDPLRRARVYLQLATASLRLDNLAEADRAASAGLAAFEEFRALPTAEFAVRASDAVWGLYARAAEIALKRGDQVRAFDYYERGRIRTPQERQAWGGRTVAVHELQRVLPADAALIAFAQFEGRLQIWVARRDGLVARTVPLSATRAAVLVASHLREIRAETAVPAASAQLYDLLLRPLARELAGIERLIVVADAPYNRIALAGLWDARRRSFVVEQHSLVVVPSASAFMWAMTRPLAPGNAGTRHASFVGPSDSQRSVVAGGISAAYGPDRTRAPRSVTGTRFQQEMAVSDIVHVAGTVVPNNEFPGLSSVAVAGEPGSRESGVIFARDFAAARPRARLVAMEGTTSPAAAISGEGPLGFARGLIAAGVPTIVTPITDIAEASVERTWVDFHRNYAGGISAADSLRRAQIAALHESQNRPGPWAALTVFGSTQ